MAVRGCPKHLKASGEKGIILLAATAMIFVLLAFVGVALDIGYLQWSRRRAQTAADAAAVEGAWAAFQGDTMVTSGRRGGADNGFTNGTNGVTVTVSSPPTAGSYTGDATAVEATISQDA